MLDYVMRTKHLREEDREAVRNTLLLKHVHQHEKEFKKQINNGEKKSFPLIKSLADMGKKASNVDFQKEAQNSTYFLFVIIHCSSLLIAFFYFRSKYFDYSKLFGQLFEHKPEHIEFATNIDTGHVRIGKFASQNQQNGFEAKSKKLSLFMYSSTVLFTYSINMFECK